MRFLLLALALGSVIPGCAAQGSEEPEGTEVASEALTSYQLQVSPQLRRGSQPSHDDLVSLRDRGYKSIVNLRTSNDERGDVLALGMDPHHIGVVDREPPTEEQVVDFLEFATQRENQPVFVHCKAGQGRTGVFVAAYRLAVQGWNLDDAMREANHLGMTSPRQEAFLREFADRLARGGVAHLEPVR